MMETVNIIYITGAAVFAALTLLLFFQIRRIWKIRYLLKNFLIELQKINRNVENILSFVKNKSATADFSTKSKPVCANCSFRQTFLVPETSNMFSYQCKLDKRNIILSDTCKRFKKDFQDTRQK